jgi:cbb3-type cytochrome oxidase subunit 1
VGRFLGGVMFLSGMLIMAFNAFKTVASASARSSTDAQGG